MVQKKNFVFDRVDVPAIVVELEQPGFYTSTRQRPRAVHRIGPPGVRMRKKKTKTKNNE